MRVLRRRRRHLQEARGLTMTGEEDDAQQQT